MRIRLFVFFILSFTCSFVSSSLSVFVFVIFSVLLLLPIPLSFYLFVYSSGIDLLLFLSLLPIIIYLFFCLLISSCIRESLCCCNFVCTAFPTYQSFYLSLCVLCRPPFLLSLYWFVRLEISSYIHESLCCNLVCITFRTYQFVNLSLCVFARPPLASECFPIPFPFSSAPLPPFQQVVRAPAANRKL